MEASEVHELGEQQHEGGESGLRNVSFTMSLLAVLLAMTTVMGHRTHTEAILAQARATDQWNFYQARHAREVSSRDVADMVASLEPRDESKAAAFEQKKRAYADHEKQEAEKVQDSAHELDNEVKLQERRAARFDIGEALLQIGVIVVSITLLTRRLAYWYLGMAFGAAGIVAALMAFLIH